jgi:HAMP domain-containing protein
MNLVLKKNAVLVAPAAMTVVARALALTVLLLAARVVLWAPMRPRRTVATSLSRPEASKPLNPPLSAFAQSPRQLP